MKNYSLDELITEARLNLGLLFPQAVLVHRKVTVSYTKNNDGKKIERELALFLIQNVDQGFMHASIVINQLDDVVNAIPSFISQHITEMLTSTEILTSNVLTGDPLRSNKECVFTNTLYFLYKSESLERGVVTSFLKSNNLSPVFCDEEYIKTHLSSSPVDVFICHDSANKIEVVRPLAKELIKRHITVWFDEQSLSLGDSLIDGIERGLQESKLAVIIVSFEFLENEAWTKREFKSLITRELNENRKIVLPIWHDVEKEAVATYSLELSDKFALSTTDDFSRLAKLIHLELNKAKN
jgi:hypothetical protein